MISNLARTVLCCINEMFHFQRDCQDIVETVLQCAPPPPHQNKVLCFVFSKRTSGIIFDIGRHDFQQVF